MKTMENSPITAEQDELQNSFFTTLNGDIPFWDHPFLKGFKVLPDKYYPYTTQEGVIDLHRRGILKEEDFILLKVLGDAVCANEDQLRRYMAPIMSRSATSQKLDRFRKNGLVERWKVRIHGDEEIKPPAPFTLGIAGFKLLKHYYSYDFFMNPNRWDDYGIGGIKRYVAMNELRCMMTEQKIVSKWKWHTPVANNPKLKFPMGTAEIHSSKEHNAPRFNLLIDRAQMNQNFIGYFREKLENWKAVYHKYGNIPVGDFSEDNQSIVVIYTSTVSIAEHIHENLLLDTYEFPIWLCVEEHLYTDGLNTSFYIPKKEKIQRIRLEI